MATKKDRNKIARAGERTLSKDSRQKNRRWHFVVFVDDLLLQDDRYTIGNHKHAQETAALIKADVEREIPEKKITVKVIPGETVSSTMHRQLIGMLQQENVLRRSLALAVADHRAGAALPESDEIYILDLKRRAIELLKGLADPKLPEPEPQSAIIDPLTNQPVKKNTEPLIVLPDEAVAAMQAAAQA